MSCLRKFLLVCVQDTTTHPAWTGVEQAVTEDEHLSKFLKRFEGFDSAQLPGRKEAEGPAAEKEGLS
jgi:ribosomal protein L31